MTNRREGEEVANVQAFQDLVDQAAHVSDDSGNWRLRCRFCIEEGTLTSPAMLHMHSSRSDALLRMRNIPVALVVGHVARVYSLDAEPAHPRCIAERMQHFPEISYLSHSELKGYCEVVRRLIARLPAGDDTQPSWEDITTCASLEQLEDNSPTVLLFKKWHQAGWFDAPLAQNPHFKRVLRVRESNGIYYKYMATLEFDGGTVLPTERFLQVDAAFQRARCDAQTIANALRERNKEVVCRIKHDPFIVALAHKGMSPPSEISDSDRIHMLLGSYSLAQLDFAQFLNPPIDDHDKYLQAFTFKKHTHFMRKCLAYRHADIIIHAATDRLCALLLAQ